MASLWNSVATLGYWGVLGLILVLGIISLCQHVWRIALKLQQIIRKGTHE